MFTRILWVSRTTIGNHRRDTLRQTYGDNIDIVHLQIDEGDLVGAEAFANIAHEATKRECDVVAFKAGMLFSERVYQLKEVANVIREVVEYIPDPDNEGKYTNCHAGWEEIKAVTIETEPLSLHNYSNGVHVPSIDTIVDKAYLTLCRYTDEQSFGTIVTYADNSSAVTYLVMFTPDPTLLRADRLVTHVHTLCTEGSPQWDEEVTEWAEKVYASRRTGIGDNNIDLQNVLELRNLKTLPGRVKASISHPMNQHSFEMFVQTLD